MIIPRRPVHFRHFGSSPKKNNTESLWSKIAKFFRKLFRMS